MKQPAEASPVACLAFLPRVVKIAMKHGYALTVHGSLRRDYDFVAVPWTERAGPPQPMVDEIVRCVSGFVPNDPNASPWDETLRAPVHRPHGRLCWAIHLGGGPYIDLCVMPLDGQAHARTERMVLLLRRIRQWPWLDTADDGAMWRREIDEALGP